VSNSQFSVPLLHGLIKMIVVLKMTESNSEENSLARGCRNGSHRPQLYFT
jgi:hypothetical protein